MNNIKILGMKATKYIKLFEDWEPEEEWIEPEEDDIKASGIYAAPNRFDDNGKQGHWYQEFDDGSKLICNYVNDKMHGPCEYYSGKGLHGQKGSYNMGRKIGVWDEYDEFGNIVHSGGKAGEYLYEDWDPEEDWEEADHSDKLASGVFKTEIDLVGTDYMIEQEEREIKDWHTVVNGEKVYLVKVDGIIKDYVSQLVITLSNGDNIEVDAHFDESPYPTSKNRDYVNISINDQAWIELDPDQYWEALGNTGSVVKAIIEFYKKHKNNT